MSLNLMESTNSEQSSYVDDGNQVDTIVQQVLETIGQYPQEIQAAVCSKLLISVANQITGPLAAKIVSGAVSIGLPEKKRSATTKGKSGDKNAAAVARFDPQLNLLHDPTDPIEAWNYFGASAESLRTALYQEPEGLLESLLSSPNMPAGKKPRGKSRKALADAIVERLTLHFALAERV